MFHQTLPEPAAHRMPRREDGYVEIFQPWPKWRAVQLAMGGWGAIPPLDFTLTKTFIYGEDAFIYADRMARAGQR